VAVKSPRGRVILDVLALGAWTTDESIIWVVGFGHFKKMMQAINILLGASIRVVHPVSVHLYRITWKNKIEFYQHYYIQ
jgi:hypothetical protein